MRISNYDRMCYVVSIDRLMWYGHAGCYDDLSISLQVIFYSIML